MLSSWVQNCLIVVWYGAKLYHNLIFSVYCNGYYPFLPPKSQKNRILCRKQMISFCVFPPDFQILESCLFVSFSPRGRKEEEPAGFFRVFGDTVINEEQCRENGTETWGKKLSGKDGGKKLGENRYLCVKRRTSTIRQGVKKGFNCPLTFVFLYFLVPFWAFLFFVGLLFLNWHFGQSQLSAVTVNSAQLS